MNSRQRSAIVTLVLLVPVVAAVMGFSAGRPNIPGIAATQVKLPFSYLTPEQVQDLWRRADRYAEAEAFLKRCGQPSHVERRMWQAAGPCIEDTALRKVAAYFRGKVLQFSQQKQFVCDTPEARRVIKFVRTKIDSDVEEVRTMCSACLIC